MSDTTRNPRAISADEQTPLLPDSADTRQKRPPTPLPKLQIAIVLALQLCEPVTSQSIYPYINQLVSELDITGGDQRKVGYYAGLIESLFFAAEALTVLQWGRVSDRIGRKPVLLVGLFGSSLSILFFGLSKTFWGLVVSRCLCGFLNGNSVVMKSVMGELTDASNRARGFSLMPLIWATGATLGALLGGSLSQPFERFPSIFTNEFWKEYPYFLPCLAVAIFVAVNFIVTATLFGETIPKRKRMTSSEAALTDNTQDDTPLPLRQVLVYPVIVAILNYVSLALMNIMLTSLMPLFFAMPVEIGGLGFDPPIIGYLWGGYGAVTGILNILFFTKILQRFGEKRAFFAGMAAYIPCFLLMPIASICARKWGVGPLVWILVFAMNFLRVLTNLSFGCIFMYINASAPSKRSLGATNGLAQMAVSISRTFGPALATSLFSYSVQKNILGGYGVYLLMIVLSAITLVLATLLPTRAWEEKDN